MRAAYERWLKEGVSPWRRTNWIVGFVVMLAAVYGYLTHPHHPGLLWYMFGGMTLVAAWAGSEVIRWRTKYKRLQTSKAAQEVAQAPSQPSDVGIPTRLRRLIADGRVLQSRIKSLSRGLEYVPANLGPDVIKWEADTSEALARYPVKQAEFEFSVSLLHNISGLGELDPDGANRVIEDALTLLNSYMDEIDTAARPNRLSA